MKTECQKSRDWSKENHTADKLASGNTKYTEEKNGSIALTPNIIEVDLSLKRRDDYQISVINSNAVWSHAKGRYSLTGPRLTDCVYCCEYYIPNMHCQLLVSSLVPHKNGSLVLDLRRRNTWRAEMVFIRSPLLIARSICDAANLRFIAMESFEETVSTLPTDQVTTPPHTEDSSVTYWQEAIGWKIDLYFTPLCIGCGVTTNFLAFCVLCQPYWRRCSTGLYMAVISIFDSVALLYGLFFWLRKHYEFDMFTKTACKPVNFFFYFAIHFDVMSLVAMTTERFVAVRFPMKAPMWCTVRNARIVLGLLALSIIGLNAHFFWTWGWVDGKCSIYKEHAFFAKYAYAWIDASLYSFIPTSSLAILNILIISTVTRPDKTLQKSNNQKQASQHITFMLLVTTSAFLVLTGPLTVLNVVKTVWRANERPGTYDYAVYTLSRRVLVALMYTNHAVNFWLYSLSGSRFRADLRGLLEKVFCRRRINLDRATSLRDLSTSQTKY
ncbi:hypothetical protein CAPTEDRAFT_207406 [Capitella teleta]|uniref:G-protein coupled receptors family 1 profile domain-containing protein n=1 Tax=Capitella teleta TaxID=283909 RepID=R7UF52_CAPTE|nr:hypothetical protein CAPTEDRAFT_207406 [Capitella teleta]|eukprot:ELU04604.1 hypothetical protein CAPTEDRAFT_207406 [Capitella teleta]